jgi:hypothetical protein
MCDAATVQAHRRLRVQPYCYCQPVVQRGGVLGWGEAADLRHDGATGLWNGGKAVDGVDVGRRYIKQQLGLRRHILR